MDSTKRLADMGEGGVKNTEKLQTSFMNGPFVIRRQIEVKNCRHGKGGVKKG